MAVQPGTGIAHLTVVPINYEPDADTDTEADAESEPEPEEPAPRTG